MILMNNDVVSQNIRETTVRLAKMDVQPGDGTGEVHLWALKTLADELLATRLYVASLKLKIETLLERGDADEW